MFVDLRYPTCSTHALYCHLETARLDRIPPPYVLHSRIFERKL